MAAVIRVKRRIFEEPVDALVINCKRRKTEENTCDQDGDSSISAILKLTVTLKTQNENISTHLSKITKQEAEDSFKRHIPNITSKIRSQQKLQAQNNRFKVTNCFRALDEPLLSENLEKNELTIVDIEPTADANFGALLEKESKTHDNYVYDLYYMNNVDDLVIDHMLSVHEASEDLVFGSYRDGNKSSEDYDSDDSNDENNYRNDYPDSDNSINEGMMRKAIGSMSIGDDLSSDEGEEGFIYSVDSEAFGLEEDIDDNDAQRYGERYARYKSRVLKDLQGNETDSDNERDDYYDCLDYSGESD